jgi:hypothetical protein
MHGERGRRATIVESMNYLDRERSRLSRNKFMWMIPIIIIFVQLVCDALPGFGFTISYRAVSAFHGEFFVSELSRKISRFALKLILNPHVEQCFRRQDFFNSSRSGSVTSS